MRISLLERVFCCLAYFCRFNIAKYRQNVHVHQLVTELSRAGFLTPTIEKLLSVVAKRRWRSLGRIVVPVLFESSIECAGPRRGQPWVLGVLFIPIDL